MIDDDPDPVEEVRAIRQKIWRKHRTIEAYAAHIKDIPSADVLLAQVREKIKKATAKPSRRPVSRRRRVPAHA